MKSFAILFSLLASPLVRADRIDDLVRAEMAKSGAPAVSIAIVQNGKLVRAQAYGYANVELKVPATPKTVFRVASMSKQFCAAAVMLLVEDGKLSVSDSIRKWFPDAPETWQPITVHHLLTHTSGIVDLPIRFESTLSNSDYLKALYAKPLKSVAGEKFEYSNPGYALLGLLVEKVSGSPLSSVVSTRILKPVGMEDSVYYTPYDIVPNRASGYQRKDGIVQNALFLRPPMLQGAGGLMATATDFAKWDIALNSDKPLSEAIKKQIYGEQVVAKNDHYGYGWYVATKNGKRTVRHSGGTIGFSSNIVRFIDEKLTVIVLENISEGGAIALSNEIADECRSIALVKTSS